MSTDRAGSGQQPRGTTRSRRVLLTGAAAALGAITAETLADAGPALASPGQPVLQSRDNTGNTRRTAVFTRGKKEWAQLAYPDHPGLGSLGIYAHGQTFGVYADSGSDGTGVFGMGNGGNPGVWGTSTDGPGVLGYPRGTNAGVAGFGGDQGGTGVTGTGGINGGVGVSGSGTGGSTGVVGVSGGLSGDGVTGAATDTGNGVVGTASGTGSGVVAQNTSAGPALNVLGPALFSRSGVLTVAAGASTGTVPGVTVSGASLVLAILQEDLPGVYVRSAVPSPGGVGFTVHLNKAASAGAKVAWFVVN